MEKSRQELNRNPGLTLTRSFRVVYMRAPIHLPPMRLELQMFLMAESRVNRGSAEVLSGCMQKEWRERLVEHALAANQSLKNAWDWNTSRKRSERRRAELSTDALNKVFTYLPTVCVLCTCRL